MTKYFSVSNALPGPIMLSHQPGLPLSGLMPAACASPENACRIRMAFDLAPFSTPYVSYATSTGVSVAPLSREIESKRTTWVSTIIGVDFLMITEWLFFAFLASLLAAAPAVS